MFKELIGGVQLARREMIRTRNLHDEGDDPDATVTEVIGAEDVYNHRAMRFLRAVRERVPSHLLPPHLHLTHVAVSPDTLMPNFSGCLAACAPLVDAFDKHAARARWRTVSAVVSVLVAFKRSVKRQFAPGGSGFARVRGEFESLAGGQKRRRS